MPPGPRGPGPPPSPYHPPESSLSFLSLLSLLSLRLSLVATYETPCIDLRTAKGSLCHARVVIVVPTYTPQA